MENVVEEIAEVLAIDPVDYSVTATGAITGTEYTATLYPYFYDSITGACMIYMPMIGSTGRVLKTCGRYLFIPSMPGLEPGKPLEKTPVLRPGEVFIKGPSGASIKMSVDKISVSAGTGLASRQYIGNSSSIMDVCRRFLLNTAGVQITAGPVIPSTQPVSPTRLSVQVKELGGQSATPPDLVLELGTTSMKGVVALLTHLASLTTILLRKTGELEMQLQKLKIGVATDKLLKAKFIDQFVQHRHPYSDGVTSTPVDNLEKPYLPEALKIDPQYTTQKVEAE